SAATAIVRQPSRTRPVRTGQVPSFSCFFAQGKISVDNPLLDYLHARQLPRPWRDVLPALAHALAARLSADELRAALRETGQAFARQRPVAASETVAAMQDAMNAIWDREDWGWVEI